MKYYVITDLHGFYDQVIDSLTKFGYFNDSMPHKLIICGDFLDRGKQAKEIVKFICDLIDKDEVILIRGNHEDLIEELVNKIEEYNAYRIDDYHFRNSTVDTISQLTDMNENDFYFNKNEVVKRIKESPLFTKILPNCLNYYETKHYIFVHGYIPCFTEGYGESNYFRFNSKWRYASKEEWQYARWYNGMKVNHLGVRELKTIVCGHVHASFGHYKYEKNGDEYGQNANWNPYYAKKLICLDGCTSRSNQVNCIIIEDDDNKNVYAPNGGGIYKCAEALKNKQAVIIPTETVYGMAAVASEAGHNKIYELKKRPKSKALPMAVNSYHQIFRFCELTNYQKKVVTKLLPGPITLVLNLKKELFGMKTIAIRYSKNHFLNKLISYVNYPLFLTSANISGEEPYKNAYEAAKKFKTKVGCYIEGKTNFDKPSTIVDLTSDEIKILREGPISLEDIKKKLRYVK